ncbi:RNA polymerase sigma factor [Catellatospora sp. NPDC049111]|uniref:RNA polymerase sigma factor n=1 Tax=Catellatospora sp. NPDC049111 TaxID=3155271 RepID=UPI0033E87A09
MFADSDSDEQLVRAAWAGDSSGLAVLLARHRAGMLAVALGVLGYGPDAEDAVQDAMLTALSRIGQLRDPAAVGPWLRTIVRNNCRMRTRPTRPIPLPDIASLPLAADGPTPDELVEQRAQRDWIWHALAGLSEPVRLVTLLRYFSDVNSYEQIAALCGVPVGTVRSRLNQGRTRLADLLRATAELAHDDAGAQAEARRREAEQTLVAAERGEFEHVVRSAWWPDLEVVTPNGRFSRGPGVLLAGMDLDLTDGVRQRIRNVLVSGDVLIWEADLISPPDDPEHCPPAVVWAHRLRDQRVSRIRLFHPRPSVAAV